MTDADEACELRRHLAAALKRIEELEHARRDERERCAQLVELYGTPDMAGHVEPPARIAAAIRALEYPSSVDSG